MVAAPPSRRSCGLTFVPGRVGIWNSAVLVPSRASVTTLPRAADMLFCRHSSGGAVAESGKVVRPFRTRPGAAAAERSNVRKEASQDETLVVLPRRAEARSRGATRSIREPQELPRVYVYDRGDAQLEVAQNEGREKGLIRLSQKNGKRSVDFLAMCARV